MISTARSNYPEILKKIGLPILELLPFFNQILKNVNTFHPLFDHICWWNGTKWRNFIEDLT
jgi:hypothetical protein